jgi:hypothetical protein
MKKYKVYWDPGMDTDTKAKVKVFTTGSPKEAYKKFLASEPKIKARLVGVDWGVFGSTLFRDHIREPSAKEKQKVEEEQEGTTEEYAAREAEEKGLRRAAPPMSEREKQEQLLSMMEDEQKGTAKLTPITHTPKAENVRETGSSLERKLDKLYDVLNHIRWIGLSIGGMFALTFIVPQCIGN